MIKTLTCMHCSIDIRAKAHSNTELIVALVWYNTTTHMMHDRDNYLLAGLLWWNCIFTTYYVEMSGLTLARSKWALQRMSAVVMYCCAIWMPCPIWHKEIMRKDSWYKITIIITELWGYLYIGEGGIFTCSTSVWCLLHMITLMWSYAIINKLCTALPRLMY